MRIRAFLRVGPIHVPEIRNAPAMNPKPKAPATVPNAIEHAANHRDRAANALKHGFSAARFVNPETLALADSIRNELTQTHQPVSQAEIDIVAELAQARAQFLEIEKARQIRIAQERATAFDRFDRNSADALDRDKTAWRQDPAGRVWILSSTFHGAKFLAELWNTVLEDIHAGLALPFDMVCDAVMALGSHWQVDKAEGDGLQLMTWYVRTAPDPAQAAELWARESKVRDGLAFARDRVARRIADAPKPSEARDELKALAKQEADAWKSMALQLRPAFESSRELAPQCAVGLGIGDPNLEKELRLLNRYATSARNNADRLQRRLESLIRNRATETRRATREPRPAGTINQPAKPCKENACDEISKRDTPLAGGSTNVLAVASIPNEITPGSLATAPNDHLANDTKTNGGKEVAAPFRNDSVLEASLSAQCTENVADELARMTPMDRLMKVIRDMQGFDPQLREIIT